jgi:hypothetical protein
MRKELFMTSIIFSKKITPGVHDNYKKKIYFLESHMLDKKNYSYHRCSTVMKEVKDIGLDSIL